MPQIHIDNQESALLQPLTHNTANDSLWRNRDYILYMIGQTTSTIGSQLSALAFPWLILTLTGSPGQAGIITAIRILPYILFGLPGGVLVDRSNRKKLMIVCDICRALLVGSIPLAYFLGYLTIIHLYTVTFIEGTLFIFFGLAGAAYLPRIVPRDKLPVAIAQANILASVSSLLGPSLSGLLYATGRVIPFVADSLSYVVSVLTLAFLRTDLQTEPTSRSNKLRHEIFDGVRWLWQHRVLRFLAFLNGGLNLSSIGYTLIILVLTEQQNVPDAMVGLIFASGGIGSIFGAFLVSPLVKHFSFRSLLIGTTWLWAITWLPFAFAPTPLLLGVAMAVASIVVPINNSIHYGYRLAQTPDEFQGRVNSIFRLILFGSQMLGMMLTGMLLELYGPVMTVLLLFVPQLLLAIMTSFHGEVRKIKERI